MSESEAGRIVSVPDVCEVRRVSPDGSRAVVAPALLIEVPHGATRAVEFDRLRRRLVGRLPEDLIDFFFVNTDVGAPECALETARRFVDGSPGSLAALLGPELAEAAVHASPRQVLIVRCQIPRTLIDCNRAIEADAGGLSEAALNAALPDYVTAEADRELLEELHRSYQSVTRKAYEQVCGAGGTALQLHTYAPRSVRVDTFDADIAQTLRRAYSPEVYERWEERPAVDLITRDLDGRLLAPAALIPALRARFAAIGVVAAENATYRLHPGTMAHQHAARYPGKTLCIELNRGLLADPFTPFEEMRIGEAAAARMSAPLAAACLERLLLDRAGDKRSR